MNTSNRAFLAKSRACVLAFRGDRSGQITIMFAMTVGILIAATGGSLDLARAYTARQKLSEVATLSCQYASRPSIVQMVTPAYQGTNGGAAYTTAVTNFITASLVTQQLGLTQTNGQPFSYTQDGPANVALSATVPTVFLKIAQITEIPITANSQCYDNPASVPKTNPSALPTEGFEAKPATAYDRGTFRYYPASGSSIATPTTSFPNTPTYTGESGIAWYGTGYCLETDDEGTINADAPEKTRSAELDCDDGNGNAGNSAISTKTYLSVGNYELRYFYRSRVRQPAYDPVYICGSTAADVVWFNEGLPASDPQVLARRTNQINVYLDRDATGTPPMHATLDGQQQLAGSNLIDVCTYTIEWVERSVRIYIGTPGSYWLSFSADGRNDSYGAQLDNIRLCSNTCTAAPNNQLPLLDNFPCVWRPADWVAESNRPRTEQGPCKKDTVLFQDTFESPTKTEDQPNPHAINKTGNLNDSLGTSGPKSGWPGQATSGWATAPFNQVNYGVRTADRDGQRGQPDQHILLHGWDNNTGNRKNRLISRRFLLDPGYYRLDYQYISIVDFLSTASIPSRAGNSDVYPELYCKTAPNSGEVFPATPAATGRIRYYRTIATDLSTNIVGAFMSHSQLVSTPVGGGALHSATSYLNPDGTTSPTPVVPPDRVNWRSYDATAVNPVLDVCGYVDSFRWVPRSVSVKISKPGYYWLTFSANGSTDNGDGGGVNDVKLTALGSLYMSSPPNPAVAIPVPGVQPGARVSFTGFYIIANPLTPTAPAQ